MSESESSKEQNREVELRGYLSDALRDTGYFGEHEIEPIANGNRETLMRNRVSFEKHSYQGQKPKRDRFSYLVRIVDELLALNIK